MTGRTWHSPTNSKIRPRREDVACLIRKHAAEWEQLGVERLSLFGSVAEDNAGPGSDVDILVDFRTGKKSFDAFMALCFRLEEILQSSVEVVTRASLGPHIRQRILESLLTVWESD